MNLSNTMSVLDFCSLMFDGNQSKMAYYFDTTPQKLGYAIKAGAIVKKDGVRYSIVYPQRTLGTAKAMPILGGL